MSENSAIIPRTKKPEWLRVKLPIGKKYTALRSLVDKYKLNTICTSGSCPNMGECWGEGTATFMILGNICTRSCGFCGVQTGKPETVAWDEPEKVARSIYLMKIKHAVITSVDRDDLKDGGAGHYATVIRELKARQPDVTIEILTPDFQRKADSCLNTIMDAKPDIFNHNLETVPRLYRSVRPGARYFTSLRLLQRAKEIDPNVVTKSGIMLGLGEERDEVLQVLDDMREANIDILTIGQYLRPSEKHHPVMKYWTPEEFDDFKYIAEKKGFGMVASGPLVRSSFHADEVFQSLKLGRLK